MKEVIVRQISIADLNNLPSDDETIAVSEGIDSTLGFAPWGGKDADGTVSKFASLDEVARVKELSVRNSV